MLPSAGHRSRGNWLLSSISAARGAMLIGRKICDGLAQHVDVVAETEVEVIHEVAKESGISGNANDRPRSLCAE